MTDQSLIEGIANLAVVFSVIGCGGTFVGNVANHYITYFGLRTMSKLNSEDAKTEAEKGLTEMMERGWVYRNALSFGSRLAYERFLRRTR